MLANIFGDWYWLVLVVIVLFGGSQLPKLARNSGEALKEFKKAHDDERPGVARGGAGRGQTALAGTPNTAAPGLPASSRRPRSWCRPPRWSPRPPRNASPSPGPSSTLFWPPGRRQVKADEASGTKPQA